MKITFAAKSATERETTLAALPEQFKGMDNEALAAAITDLRAQGKALMGLESFSVDQVDEAEALRAALAFAKAEDKARKTAVKDAEKRFTALGDAFEDDTEDEDADPEADPEVDPDLEPNPDLADPEADPEEDPEVDPEVEAAKGENPFDPKKKKKADDEEEDKDKKAMTASGSQVVRRPAGSTARKAAAKTQRPAVKATSSMVITASADIPGVSMGSTLDGIPAVAKAAISRAGGFPKHSERSARTVAQASNGQPVLNKFSLASFGLDFDPALVASGSAGQEYNAVQAAIKAHETAITAAVKASQTLTAAGWCAPSEIAYNYIADYVIDGLMTTPQVGAPRGGLMTTTGPALADEYALDGSDFGWTHTEAMSEARTVKTCETILCPEFVDNRLDAVGYCWKIPILTQKAYPELVTDALRLSAVLYAHKMNARFIANSLALSTAVSASGLGGSFDDTLEALAIVATKERRRWNVGENKVMEVKAPMWVKEVFRAEIGRRPFRTTPGPVTDQMINAEFTARNLAPEWVTDWAMLTGPDPRFPATLPVMIYPSGTFVKAVEDVINLSAVYDAASLSVNEYTGVFYEQGVMLYKAAYGSTKFDIPVCTAGLVGAPVLDCAPLTPNTNGNAA